MMNRPSGTGSRSWPVPPPVTQAERSRVIAACFTASSTPSAPGKRTTLPSDANLSEILERSVQSLPDTERRLIQQKYFESASVRELAVAFDLTEKAVESRLLRARQSLREAIEKELKRP